MLSIWNDTSEFVKVPTVESNMSTDVLIIGGGITGILCAYRLKNSGIDYILL